MGRRKGPVDIANRKKNTSRLHPIRGRESKTTALSLGRESPPRGHGRGEKMESELVSRESSRVSAERGGKGAY